jgi:hypothetical protein
VNDATNSTTSNSTWLGFMLAHGPTLAQQERALRAVGLDPDPAAWSDDDLEVAARVLSEQAGRTS